MSDQYSGISHESAEVFRLADSRAKEQRVQDLARRIYVQHLRTGTPGWSVSPSEAFVAAEQFVEHANGRWESLK